LIALRLDDDNGARFGACIITEGTTSAIVSGVISRVITGTVELFADSDDALGANTDAQLAALAELRIDFHGGNLNGGFVDH
jgi:hypothetical protein